MVQGRLLLMTMVACALLAGPAPAGPNAYGTIFVHDASFVVQTDYSTLCGLGTPPASCRAADVNLEGSSPDTHKLWKVYASFVPGSSPRLKAMTFGVSYDPDVRIAQYGSCAGDLNNGGAELPGPGWPGSDTGTAMVFQYTQTTELVECYFFGGYSYYGNPCLFRLRDHPDPILGGNFADDQIPSVLDRIEGYGTLGLDTPGEVACPDIPIPPIGACCVDSLCTVTTAENCPGTWLGPDTDCDPNPCFPPQGACCINGECLILSQPDCEEHHGQFIGQGVPCEPDPCQPNPTRTTTWGRIKHEHR